jgi:hypothetical protein
MKNYEIKTATADYTGGGIYIFYGQLENGLYFRTCDDWESIAICTEPTDTEEADYQEFFDDYMTEEITGSTYENLFSRVLWWILTFKPEGNYNSSDLEKRIYQLNAVQVERDIKTWIRADLVQCIDDILEEMSHRRDIDLENIDPVKLTKLEHHIGFITDILYSIGK